MRWFWAWTVQMTLKKKHARRNKAFCEVWKNLILVRAHNAEEAYDKACAIGRLSEGDDQGRLTLSDQPATTVFLGLADFGVVHDPLRHGAEILWQEKWCNQSTARKMVCDKSTLCREVAEELKYVR